MVTLASVAATSATAQDSIAASRHLFALDLTRVRPFARSYDMLVYAGDSVHLIGQRDVSLAPAIYAGSPAWLVIETRTGMVPAADSLYLASDMRPIHWGSMLGPSRLGAEFSGDSIYGATSTPATRHSFVLESRPDLLVSSAMIEVLAGLLPLASAWSDSGAVLAVDAGVAVVIPAELAVIAEIAVPGTGGDSGSTRNAWLLNLKTDRSQAQYWVDSETGDVLRVEQALPSHVGSRIEFRSRPAPTLIVIPPGQ